MRYIFIIFALGTFFSAHGQKPFDFPIYIGEQTDSIYTHKSEIDEYVIDSIDVLFGDSIGSFRFLKLKEHPKSCKRVDSTNSIDVSIDFVGVKYIRIGDRVYFVLNPYFDLSSKITVESKASGNMTTSSVFINFIPVFSFSKFGELIDYPNRGENQNANLFLKSLLKYGGSG